MVARQKLRFLRILENLRRTVAAWTRAFAEIEAFGTRPLATVFTSDDWSHQKISICLRDCEFPHIVRGAFVVKYPGSISTH
jgi:hypothetical protein